MPVQPMAGNVAPVQHLFARVPQRRLAQHAANRDGLLQSRFHRSVMAADRLRSQHRDVDRHREFELLARLQHDDPVRHGIGHVDGVGHDACMARSRNGPPAAGCSARGSACLHAAAARTSRPGCEPVRSSLRRHGRSRGAPGHHRCPAGCGVGSAAGSRRYPSAHPRRRGAGCANAWESAATSRCPTGCGSSPVFVSSSWMPSESGARFRCSIASNAVRPVGVRRMLEPQHRILAGVRLDRPAPLPADAVHRMRVASHVGPQDAVTSLEAEVRVTDPVRKWQQWKARRSLQRCPAVPARSIEAQADHGARARRCFRPDRHAGPRRRAPACRSSRSAAVGSRIVASVISGQSRSTFR